ncbi:hypothetical protein BDZ94DRAFT_1181804 [Collybia nuda]|uniref:DUF7918 domain-containing protein n=1 Tax=Collybia nuda TaxID=64659 RepID=A0A9P5YHP6_9AGAR|nr:hypothetical protein BDZ94DRAFT_1181804 [Collybia nuda]
MLTHRGFSAWIMVDGKPLPEYLVAVDNNSHRVSCWIPSEEGQAFTVFWKDHGGKVDTCAFITLDGFVVPGRFLFGEGLASRQGVRTSKSSERPFMFQRIEAKDEQNTSEAGGKEVGMVTLRIKRIERLAAKPANMIQNVPQTILGKRKAGELRIGFGEEMKTVDQYATTWSVKPYGAKSTGEQKANTYVSFVFRYRSRDFLESQGILTEPEAPMIPVVPQRPTVRRVVSMPSTMPIYSPSPSPPKKKQKFPIVRGQQTNKPLSNTRRAASYVVPSKKHGFPGQGVILFHDGPNISVGSEGSSTEDGGSQ